ncbi:hypothetical protein Dimus_038521 [Dionaea muscipula]
MDFLTGLPTTRNGHDVVWVIVDRLTKSTHFLPVKVTFSLERLTRLYIREIIRLHGAPVTIVSDRDPRFVSKFWGALHREFGTRLSFSTAYHPQTDGQSERTIQTLEDMLRACALDWRGNWDDHLPLMEFSYNNSFHSSIEMAPYEALYGRKCRSPSCWVEVGERQILGPELVDEASQMIAMITERLATAQSRQKSYADHRRRDLEFQVGDKVFLKVSPWRGTIRFGQKGKMSPRFIGPFEILDRVGVVSYRLALPPSLEGVHNVFHVFMLRKYVHSPDHIIDFEPLHVREDLTFEEQPVEILDRKDKVLRNKTVPLVKVLWRNQVVEEATWEREDEMREKFPHFF